MRPSVYNAVLADTVEVHINILGLLYCHSTPEGYTSLVRNNHLIAEVEMSQICHRLGWATKLLFVVAEELMFHRILPLVHVKFLSQTVDAWNMATACKIFTLTLSVSLIVVFDAFTKSS